MFPFPPHETFFLTHPHLDDTEPLLRIARSASMAPKKERPKASNGKSNGDAAAFKRIGEAKK